jgi:hypothetical protein
MTARNQAAFARGQRIRAAIRAYLLEQAQLRPFSRRPTWRQIQAHLHEHRYYLERSAICHHVAQIEIEAELRELDRSPSDSFQGGAAAS